MADDVGTAPNGGLQPQPSAPVDPAAVEADEGDAGEEVEYDTCGPEAEEPEGGERESQDRGMDIVSDDPSAHSAASPAAEATDDDLPEWVTQGAGKGGGEASASVAKAVEMEDSDQEQEEEDEPSLSRPPLV